MGTRVLPSKNTLEDRRLDGLSMHAVAPHGLGARRDEAQLQLMTESEKRIAAEAKASRFEASAKVALNLTSFSAQHPLFVKICVIMAFSITIVYSTLF